MKKNSNFEVMIHIFTDNQGITTEDTKTRMNGEEEWRVEPTLTYKNLGEAYEHLSRLYKMLAAFEKAVIQPMQDKVKPKSLKDIKELN